MCDEEGKRVEDEDVPEVNTYSAVFKGLGVLPREARATGQDIFRLRKAVGNNQCKNGC